MNSFGLPEYVFVTPNQEMKNSEQDIPHPQGDLKVKFVSSQPSEQCGCPEEDWIMGGIEVTIHLEEDGSGHLLFYGGDWEHDFEVDCSDMAELRQKAVDYICSLPME